jgi:hypothetical protein
MLSSALLFLQKRPKSSSQRVISRHKWHRWIWLLLRYYIYLSFYLKQTQTQISCWPYILLVISWKRGELTQWRCTPMPWKSHRWISWVDYAPSFLVWYFGSHSKTSMLSISFVMSVFIIPLYWNSCSQCWQMASTSERLKMQSKSVKQLCKLFPMRRVSLCARACVYALEILGW